MPHRVLGCARPLSGLDVHRVAGAVDNAAMVAPILRIVRDAAATEDMAAQWHTNQQQRRTAHRMLAEHLADRRALRPDVTVEQATDVLYALISLELYVLLTADCGWTPDRWQQWTTTAALNAGAHRPPT